jgi:hypothetical protein
MAPASGRSIGPITVGASDERSNIATMATLGARVGTTPFDPQRSVGVMVERPGAAT